MFRGTSHRLTADARVISAAIAWQFGEKRRSLVSRDSPLARNPARDAARFLERCLAELGREEARCRLVLGRLLAIFGRKCALTKLGFVRLSDYSSERLGISGSEAEVTTRVAKRLESLPRLREAFLDGRVSWTKARTIAPVADLESEERWIELAGRHTVRELEKIVAAEGAIASDAVALVRADDAVEVDGEPRARFRMRAPAWAWLFFHRVVGLARTVAGESGAGWQAVETITAEGLDLGERDPFAEDVEVELEWLSSRRGRSRAGERWRPVPRPEARDDDDPESKLPEVARWLGVDEASLRRLRPVAVEAELEHAADADPIALDARLRAVVRAMQTIDARIGRLLHLLSERRLYRELGFFDLESYVTELQGLGLRKARSLIAIDRAAAKQPMLRAAYEAGSPSWVRALALLPLVREGSRIEPWVERARRVTVRRLVDEVTWALERRVVEGGPALPPPLGARLDPVQMRVDAESVVADREIEFFGPASVVSTLERLAVAWSEPDEAHWQGLVRLLAAVAGKWFADGRKSGIREHERRILERDGYRCLVPGCSSRRNLEVHHLVFRSAGGGEEDWNRGALCAGHHHHCLHTFTVVARGRAPEAIDWVFGASSTSAPLMRLHGEAYAEP